MAVEFSSVAALVVIMEVPVAVASEDLVASEEEVPGAEEQAEAGD